MALSRQMLGALREMHPEFASNVNDEGLWRGTYPVSLVDPNTLQSFRTLDRAGKDARSDSSQAISSIRDDLEQGMGLREPIVLSHNHNLGLTGIDEGHHRVEAARSAGGILLPTVAQVQDYGVQGGRKVGRIKSLRPNEHGWFPKVADPDLVMRGH